MEHTNHSYVVIDGEQLYVFRSDDLVKLLFCIGAENEVSFDICYSTSKKEEDKERSSNSVQIIVETVHCKRGGSFWITGHPKGDPEKKIEASLNLRKGY